MAWQRLVVQSCIQQDFVGSAQVSIWFFRLPLAFYQGFSLFFAFAFGFGGGFFLFGFIVFDWAVFVFFGGFGFAFVGFAVLFAVVFGVFAATVVLAAIVRRGGGFAFDYGFNELGLAGMGAAGDFERLPCFDAVAFDFVQRGKLGYVHVVAFGDAV
jgi:hypothetical protein